MSRRADAIRCGAASAAPQRFQPRLRRLRLTVVPPTPRFVDSLLLVWIRRDVSERDRENLLARAGVTAVRRIPHLGVIVVRMPPPHRDAALAELRTSNLVAHAER